MELSELFGRSAALVFLLDHQLPFLDHVHEFNPGEGGLRCLERFEPEHGTGDALHPAMVLFDNVI